MTKRLIERGSIWWVSLDPTQGSEIKKTRPCVVMTHNTLNELRSTIVVVPLSTVARLNPPITIHVKCAGKPAVAVVDQVRAVAKHRLKGKIGDIEANDLKQLESALKSILSLA